MCSQRQTDTHADTHGPPLRQNKHQDLELEAYKHTLSHTRSHIQADGHTVTQSPLSVTGTAASAVLELAIILPLPLPGPFEPQLSVPGTKDSVGEEEAKGATGGSGLHSVAAGERLFG